MEPENVEGLYLIDCKWLTDHKQEHYDIQGDKVVFSTDPYVTSKDIYAEAERLEITLGRLREICAAEAALKGAEND